MEVVSFKVCKGSVCESYTAVAQDIEKKLNLENVRIDQETGKVSYDNPKQCQVNERLLEEAASQPGRNIQFEQCE